MYVYIYIYIYIYIYEQLLTTGKWQVEVVVPFKCN